MILITSASYIDQEFSSEFGLIPPAFLPVGNRRLFTYQTDCFDVQENTYLSVPESFSVSPHDQELLDQAGVTVLKLPEGISLGESILQAISLAQPKKGEPLRILHGDTLITDLPQSQLDILTLSVVDGAYNWAVFDSDGDEILSQLGDNPLGGRRQIANGYFAFSDWQLFARCIEETQNSFIQGINKYAKTSIFNGIETNNWLDFGHIHTYYRSKAQMTTQRAFNNLKIGNRTVRKTSDDDAKMNAELNWFRSVPDELRIYLPQLIGAANIDGKAGYEVEYLYLTSLNELFVFGKLPRFVWRKIFDACFTFIDTCRDHPAGPEHDVSAEDLFLNKTIQRLEDHSKKTGISLDKEWSINGKKTPSLKKIAHRTSEIISGMPDLPASVIHGDFCFSNVLFDFRTESIKTIDPRGMSLEGNYSIFGDQRYDLAKLAHSVLGLYDFIIAGYLEAAGDGYELEIPPNTSTVISDIQSLFLLLIDEKFGISETQITAMQIHLFLSMLPLHADSPARQRTLLANALRLYIEMNGADEPCS